MAVVTFRDLPSSLRRRHSCQEVVDGVEEGTRTAGVSPNKGRRGSD